MSPKLPDFSDVDRSPNDKVFLEENLGKYLIVTGIVKDVKVIEKITHYDNDEHLRKLLSRNRGYAKYYFFSLGHQDYDNIVLGPTYDDDFISKLTGSLNVKYYVDILVQVRKGYKHLGDMKFDHTTAQIYAIPLSVEITTKPIPIVKDHFDKKDAGIFNTISIPRFNADHPIAKVSFTLSNSEIRTGPIEISQMDMTFLLFLCLERKNNGENWQKNPTNRLQLLRNVCSGLNPKGSFYKELDEKPTLTTNRHTWIWDTQNKIRKTHASQIKSSINAKGIKGSIFPRPLGGVYTLAPFLRNIEL